MDYYIPLPKLLPSLPADLLHKLGPAAEQFVSRVGVRRVREVWNDTHAVFTGEVVLTGELSLGPFVLGTPGDGTTEFAFELVTDRLSLLHHALAAGEGAFTPGTVPPESDAQVKAILAADGPPLTFRLRLHLPQLRFRPDREKFVLGDLVRDPATGNVIGINERPGSPPLDLLIADISLVLDSAKSFVPDWEDFDVELLPTIPPFVWRYSEDSSFGFEGTNVRLDLSKVEGIPQVLGRPGYTEEWIGLFIGQLRMFGLEQVCPVFPPVLELTEWIIGFNDGGVSGRAEFVWPREAGDKTTARLERLSLEIDRGHFVRLGGEMSIYLTHDDADPEDDAILLIGLAFRDAPDGGWAGEATLRVPTASDDALYSFPVNYLPLVFTGTAATLAATADSADALIPIALLGIGGWLQFGGQLALTELAVTRFTSRFFTQDVNGRRIRFIDAVIDVRAKLQLDMPPILILPALQTPPDQPIGIELRELTFRFALNGGDDVPVFDFVWPANSITFSNTEQLTIGELVLHRVGLGRWDEGLWIELGVKLREARGGSGVSAFVVRLYFSEAGGWAFDHATMENSGFNFSLLLPEVLYVHGALQWLDGLQGSLRAFIVGNGTGAPDRYKERGSWIWEIAATLAEKTVVDLETNESFRMLVITGDFENASGFPLLSTGASAYGLSAQYVQNARPKFDAAHSNPPDYGWWFMDLEPRYRLDASKWAPAKDANGFGLGIALGSSFDGGRAWKVKGGVLVQSGPVIVVHARGDVLGKPPTLGQPPGASSGFAAAVVWDGVEKFFSADLRFERKVPASGKILQLSAPLKVFADFEEKENSYLHIGQHWPMERRVLVRLLKTLDVSFYVMVDGRGIQDLAGHSEIDVPGTAFALGIGGRWEKGLKKGPLRCYFRLIADANFVFSLGELDLIAGAFTIDGGLGLKVYGLGFELHVYADLAWLLGRVWGKIGVRVGLPWPLPDVKAEIPFGMGDPSALPEPTSFTQALVMSRPGDRATAPISADTAGVLAANAPAVPINAALSLSFAYPTRSAASTTSFVLSDSKVTTSHVAAAEHEYIFDLEDLVLWKGEAGTGTVLPGPYAGVWKAEPVKTAGGKDAARVLHLLTWDQIDARHVGPSAEYLDGALETYDPCSEPLPVKEVCFDVHAEPYGPVVPGRTLTAPTGQRLEVSSRSPLFTSESALRRDAVFAQHAEVVPCPVSIPGVDAPRAILLPSFVRYGGFEEEVPPPHAADTLVLRHALAAEAVLVTLAQPEQGFVTVRFFRGEELVHEDSGTPFGSFEAGFMRSYHRSKFPSTRAEIVARHVKASRNETRLPHLLGACFVFQADLDAHAQQEATHQAWSQFWSDLLGAGGAANGGQLLEPETRYTLEARVRWRHRDPTTGDETSPSASKITLFPFVTEGAEAALARTLRPRSRDFTAAGDDWDVETVPADGEEAIYTERPLHLTFRDGRFDAYYARFGRRVVMRLVDERGQDLFDGLEYLATHATELPEYQQTWYEFVTEGCAPGGASVLWHAGSARFTTVLETNMRYEAALVPVEEPFDPDTVDWSAYKPLHTFRFRTSRWPNLTAHLAAHEVLDEVAGTAGVADLAALFTALGSPAPGRRLDDQALDNVLAALGLPPRPPAAVPEVVRVWRATEDGHEVCALLIDGPEPLVRDAASQLAVREAPSTSLPVFVLGARSGTRLLVFFRQGAGFGVVSASVAAALQLDVSHPFAGLNGLPAAEQTSLTIQIPSRPPFFDEEAP